MSIHTLSITAVLGLGLAIDDALFVVPRYREEVAKGCVPHAAVRRTVHTALRRLHDRFGISEHEEAADLHPGPVPALAG